MWAIQLNSKEQIKMLRIFFLEGIMLSMVVSISAKPIYHERLIFPLQDKHVHSSCIIECPNGDLLACWFHGSGERTAADVVIQGARLSKGSKEWGKVFMMADTPELPDCNPVLFIDRKNQLWLFWIAVPAQRWEESLLRYRKATDYQGEGPPKWTWQDEIILEPGDKFVEALTTGFKQVSQSVPGFDGDFGGHTTSPMHQLLTAAQDKNKRQRGWMTRTHMMVLPSGRWLLPLYSDGFYVGLMAISDDQGDSWRAGSPIVGACLNQPSVVRKRDGRLVAYMREEGDMQKRVLSSVSNNDGETWSVAEYTDIPNPNSSLEVITLRDGRWVMVYNDSEETRDTLAIAMSDDEGATWKWQRHLEQKKGGQFHYPSVIQTKDGLVQITYTYQPGGNSGKAIKHVTLNTEWIIEGDK